MTGPGHATAGVEITAGGAGLKPEEVAALVVVLDALGGHRPPPPPVTERANWRLPADGGPGAVAPARRAVDPAQRRGEHE